MSRQGIFVAAALLLAATAGARADADADWAQIQAMDSNGPSQQWQSQEEARDGTIEYLGKQEKALRDFIADYPADTHLPDAKLRLAHLLATRADFAQDSTQRLAANAILDELETEPGMKNRRADVEFARVSIFMQRVDPLSGANRGPLLEKARGFAKEFPDDRRVAPLLADVAGVFEEDEPKTARTLLEQALPKAQTPELKASISDDLKRLALLGKPLEMKWTAIDGTRVNLDNLRGKVVLIYFFASWSPPSMLELDWVRQLAGRVPADTLQPLGICLDNDPVAVPSVLDNHEISWPVYCDGRGWQGTLVRSLGVNEIPVLWIVDRDGVLRALDAKDDAVQIIEKAAGDSGQ
jgi:thiol-disulfide isomerase/thioredoxin